MANSRQELIDNGIMTTAQAAQFDNNQLYQLASQQSLRDLIANGTMTIPQAAQFGANQLYQLASQQSLRDLIANGTMTIDQAAWFDAGQLRLLASYQTLRDLIANGTMTIDQAAQFDANQLYLLASYQTLRDFIANGHMTIPQAAQFDSNQLYQLASQQSLRDLIANGTMTIDQAAQFDNNQLYTLSQALGDAETRERLRNGNLTIQDIVGNNINNNVDENNNNDAIVPVNINEGQSTHTASVHQAVSESASKLRNNYGDIVLNYVISQICAYVSQLDDSTLKNQAAKRCIARITADDYYFTDPTSQVTTRQLLALTFSAIHDGDKRIGDLNDALARFVEGLYEIQRGYNLSATGTDMGGEDKYICSAGTFNKLIEKLQGIHPDCEIRFITKEIAALKLPIVVQEEAMRYLSQLASPQNVNELLAFTQLIDSIKANGTEVVWDKIKQHVTDRMFDEFGSLYSNSKQDAGFSAFIEAGMDTELKNLSRFQKQIQESPGYYQYCSNTLRQQSIYNQKQGAIINNSHNSSEPPKKIR